MTNETSYESIMEVKWENIKSCNDVICSAADFPHSFQDHAPAIAFRMVNNTLLINEKDLYN